MATETTTVKITRRETIKPSSPTPKHLKTLKISKLDQLAVDMYIPLVLFYPFDTNLTDQKNPHGVASERSEHLRKTLSKALVHFYPLAGRLRNNLCVECNDDGVEFFEAREASSMLELLRKPDLDVVTQLVPTLVESREASLGGRPFLVQVTIFGCGGIALGLSFSHKICDACSMAAFLDTWTKIARGDEAIKMKPEFGKMTGIFPPSMDLSLSSSATSGVDLVEDKCITRRYVFEPKKIAALKRKATSSDGVANPSRVEAVAGLIWKCVEDWRSKNPKTSRKSVWWHYLNMRTRFMPALASNVIGNLVGVYYVETEESERGNIGLEGLVIKLRRAVEEVKESYAESNYSENIKKDYEDYAKQMKCGDQIDIYHISSWCRFGLYESDFGWEKPIWASLVCSSFKNNIYLMDSNGGDGIEVWFYLTEEDMAMIETNDEFLAFATLNPSVV